MGGAASDAGLGTLGPVGVVGLGSGRSSGAGGGGEERRNADGNGNVCSGDSSLRESREEVVGGIPAAEGGGASLEGGVRSRLDVDESASASESASSPPRAFSFTSGRPSSSSSF